MNRQQLPIIGVFALVLVLGLVASYMVHRAVDEVGRSSEALVESAMAEIRGLDAFRTALLEHERLAYEAYGAIEPDKLVQRQKGVRERITQGLERLDQWGLEAGKQQRFRRHFEAITQQSRWLYTNLRGEGTDWDAARSQLAAMTEHRRAMEPALVNLADRLEKQARAVNAENRANLRFMGRLVWLYTAAILIIAAGAGWAIARIFRGNRENRALAEFPARNPNPVLKLDSDLNVVYANPAAAHLAEAVGEVADGGSLIDADITAAVAGEGHGCRESLWEDRILWFEWDWLADLGSYHVYVRDITDQRRAEDRLRHMAYEDGVTGLPNRDGLLVALEACSAEGRPGVVMVRLDRFEPLVAQSGFEAADAILTRMGEALRGAAADLWGEEAVVARLDGALFGLLVPDGADLGVAEAERLLAELPGEVRTEHTYFPAELRAGVRHAAERASLPSQLLSDANTALVAAERDEARRVVVHDDALRAAEAHRAEVEACLRDALRRDRGLQLYIQPKLRLRDEAIVGGEILVRWQDPDLGWVSPGEFIPVAEQSGLIREVGQWILARALDQLAEWQDDPATAGAQVAVNVAAPELHDPQWAEGVLKGLAERGLGGELLEVEVTERVFAGVEDSATVANLHRLREAGVSVAVDDFGTGYSSLAYIHRLPIDRVKIDKQFVDPLPVPPGSISLARVVVEMADGLGLETIAEGVENGDQAEALHAMGCPAVQGFYYARPMPTADFAERMRAGRI